MRTHRCRTRGCTVAPLLGSVDVQDRQPPAKPAQQRTPRRARRDAGRDRPVRRPWDRRSVLTRFLYVNLRGHRALVVVAVSLTIGLVLCDLGLAFPLKFILDKYVNHQDPSFPLSGSVLPWFNHFGSTHGLVAGEHYTTVGVIVYSTSLLLALGLIEAALSYAQLFIAAFIGQSLAAHLRTRLFDHLQRLSLEWHSRQHTGDLVQRLTGNIADIEKLVRRVGRPSGGNTHARRHADGHAPAQLAVHDRDDAGRSRDVCLRVWIHTKHQNRHEA